MNSTVGQYLAARLEQIGLEHYFAVPGDYNLVLLDELLANDNLQMVSCCNELNAGYAADGYARATRGPSAAVVTYSVGGLSILNALAGAYAENLPMIVISGGPNTNSAAEYEYLHHTLGKVDFRYQRNIFARITHEAMIIQHPDEAPAEIDRAINSALIRSKPVYIEIASNIPKAPVSAPHSRSFGVRPARDDAALEDAVDAVAELLNSAVKPVLVAGSKVRMSKAEEAFAKLVEASDYAYATMPDAKSFADEEHPHYLGTYWGPVSSPGCAAIVEAADVQVFAGGVFNDYTTAGHAALLEPNRMVQVRPNSVIMPGQTFSNVRMGDFLSALADKVTANDTSVQAHVRIKEDPAVIEPGSADTPTTTRQLFARVQRLIDSDTTVLVETGDSWFNGMKLRLPSGSKFEIQMQYGSIGWSVGATLGYALGAPDRRLVAMIGDGSFQMTAQELSTMIRYGTKPIIFLINNGGYTIEVEIHDGPYNVIKNWDYSNLMDVFSASDGNGWGTRVATEGELDAAIAKAVDHDGPSLIEVMIDRDDCSADLLQWGGYVAKNNGRPPRTR